MPSLHDLLLTAAHAVGITSLVLRVRRDDRCLTVLHYHGVRSPLGEPFDPGRAWFVTPEDLRKQVRFVKRQYIFTPLHQAAEWLREGDGSRPLAALTFDLPYASVLEEGLPVLAEERVPFTVFLPSEVASSEVDPWWVRLEDAVRRCRAQVTVELEGRSRGYDLGGNRDKRRLFQQALRAVSHEPAGTAEGLADRVIAQIPVDSARNGSRGALSWEAVRVLVRSPLADIGSHGVHLGALSPLPLKSVRQEMQVSKREIEANAGVRVFSFCYPDGEGPQQALRAREHLTEAGYRCALVGEEGINRPTTEPFELRRVSILGQDSWPVFVAKVAGLDALLRRVG